MLDSIERFIQLEGNMTDEQRNSLMAIAGRCPVHRSLNSQVHIVTHHEAGVSEANASQRKN